MADYVHELNKINPKTGKSLEQEINDQLNTVHKLEYYLKRMESTLKALTGIEADLYKEIVINGTRISKAVEKIASNYDKDVSTIWRLYHKRVKEYVNMLKVGG
jgi:adenine-specific DNA methylase